MRWTALANSAHFYELRADELRVDLRFAVFEKHRKNLAEVGIQLVERFSLRVSPGKPGMKPARGPVSGDRSTTAVNVFIQERLTRSTRRPRLAIASAIPLSPRLFALRLAQACVSPRPCRKSATVLLWLPFRPISRAA